MVRDWVKNARSVDEDDDSVMTPPRVAATAAATTGSGFLSGSMGIGGGLLNVPLLVYVLGRNTRKAIGTSSLLIRSEEHTSELQSHSDLVCRLLLEKKKNEKRHKHKNKTHTARRK